MFILTSFGFYYFEVKEVTNYKVKGIYEYNMSSNTNGFSNILVSNLFTVCKFFLCNTPQASLNGCCGPG